MRDKVKKQIRQCLEENFKVDELGGHIHLNHHNALKEIMDIVATNLVATQIDLTYKQREVINKHFWELF